MSVQGIDPPSELSEAVVDSLSGLPYYFANLAAALVVLTAVLALYVVLSRSRELIQAREGNVAAAASFAGVALGISLPIASAVLTAGALLDQLLWSTATALVQLVVILVVRRSMGTFAAAVNQGRFSAGLVLAAIAVVIGLLNAAATAAF